MRAREAFRKAYKGATNFMTPTVVWQRRFGRFAVELSAGRGMDEDLLYGVTVLEITDAGIEKRHDLSTCFPTRRQAEEYTLRLDTEEGEDT